MESSAAFQAALDDIALYGQDISNALRTSSTTDNLGYTHVDGSQVLLRIPHALSSSQKALAEAATQLLQLVVDPTEYLDRLASNNQNLVCLRWLVNLHILEHIPLSTGISYDKLASIAHVPQSQLKGVARMAIVHGFLSELEPGIVSHSRNSALLITDPNFMNWARWMTNYSVPTAYKLPEATKCFGNTEAKNETAFNLAMDMSQPFFDYLRKDSEMNTMFSGYMRNVASTAGTSFEHLVNGYDWGNLTPDATVVDVGGSSGHASLALAAQYPNLNFIVQDLPETIANARSKSTDTNASNKSLSPKVQFMEHDFFKTQPVTNAEIYLLRMIIHDWPDTEAIKILKNLKHALGKPGARIIVMDTVLPQPGTISMMQERQLRVRDLTMMQVFNAKERENEDWSKLVKEAGLELFSINQPPGSVMGILEIGLPDQTQSDNGLDMPLTNGNVPKVDEPVLHAPDVTEHHRTNGFHSASSVTDENSRNGMKDFEEKRDQPIAAPNSVHKLPVLVIGAGIGGLTLAQGLRKAGIEVLVFERDMSEAYRPQGYRLKLEADAAEALRESLPLQLYEDFQASCAISTVGETDFDPMNGNMVTSRAGGGLAGAQGLRASFTADRSVLRNVLMTGLEDAIEFGKDLVSYDVDTIDESLVVTFKDGTSARGSFLVGADGVRSAVRKQYLPNHSFVDTGAICIYGKTQITPELTAQYPAKALRWMTVCADRAPLIQSILIGDSPLTLLSEPIRFDSKQHGARLLPEDYVYWVLIGRKEIFAGNETEAAQMATGANGPKESANMSLDLTAEWHPTLRSLFELQDVQQCSTLRVVSAKPQLPPWTPSRYVTVIGDAIHAMSPCGGVGANTALRDAAELMKTIVTDAGRPTAASIGRFEDDLRKRTFRSLMRSYAGSKKMFDQRPFEECQDLDL